MPSWQDIALRLVLTVIAGGLIGLNREEGAHTAGLRTTLLVCLAASVAMIQMNLLMPVAGKPPSGFGVMDLMRLPLGILTGIGFIGGGAILRRGSLVTGVTTAATIWMTTVIGLCLGGGQLIVGVVATIITLFILAGLKTVDRRLPKVRRGTVELTAEAGADARITADELEVERLEVIDRRWQADERRTAISYEVRYGKGEERLLERLAQVGQRPGIVCVHWARTEDSG